MKKIQVIVDGKRQDIVIEEDTLEALLLNNPLVKNGYERVGNMMEYYAMRLNGDICDMTESNDLVDKQAYESGNYYSNIKVAKNNIRADCLMRQLRRFAVENCKEVPWDNNAEHWYIRSGMVNKSLFADVVTYAKDFGGIYFDTQEITEKAIEIFKDELLWYFTEYRDRL